MADEVRFSRLSLFPQDAELFPTNFKVIQLIKNENRDEYGKTKKLTLREASKELSKPNNKTAGLLRYRSQ